MVIQRGDFVKISYTGRLEDGTVFDTTSEELAKQAGIYNPELKYGKRVVIVGAYILPRGLEVSLEGKEVGYSGRVELAPEDGYGYKLPELIEVIPLSKFRERVYPGVRVLVDGKLGVVESVMGSRVRVDFNHPLAGKKLVYEYEIREKIQDPKEKLRELLGIYLDPKLSYQLEFDSQGGARIIMDFLVDADLKRLLIMYAFGYIGLSRLEFLERITKSDREKELKQSAR